MARPTDALIRHLRHTANKIESEEWDYHWPNSSSCNCGLLARSVVGEPVEVGGTWGRAADPELRGMCLTTGVSLEDVLRKLRDLGLTASDIKKLETFGHEAVVQEAGFSGNDNYDDKQKVVTYMRTWADLLERAQPLVQESNNKKDQAHEQTQTLQKVR